MKKANYFPKLFSIELIIFILALIFLAPFYFIVVNSFKPFGAIILNAASIPKTLYLHNYIKAWQIVNFPRVFINSLLITTFSIIGMLFMGSMAAWRLTRRSTKINTFIFFLFVSAMVIPFQSVMIPMVKVSHTLGLINSIPGIVIIYFGFGMPLTVFLLHGFIKSVPKELEESAYIDGCSTLQSFFRIVFPLLRTINVTVIILQTLWLWNDFLLPMLVLFDSDKKTIPLGVFSFFGQYLNQWDMALATLVMGMLPAIIFFLFLQNYIIKGIITGSIKG